MSEFNLTPYAPHIMGAANHAILSGDESALDEKTLSESVLDGVRTGIGIGSGAAIGFSMGGPLGALAGAVVGGATGYDWRMTAATTISGVNQLYNSGVAIASLLPGVDLEEADTEEWATAVDDDLGQYYAENKEGLDIAGFVVSSFGVGLKAVNAYTNISSKVLKAAANGNVGANIGTATGLLGYKQNQMLALARQSMQSSGAAFNLTNKHFLLSVGAGVGEAALQGLVFEGAVQVALNQSPILSEQDAGDIAKNMWTAAWVSGAVGGVLGAAVDAIKLRTALGKGDAATLSARLQSGFQEGTEASEAILASYVNRAAVKVPSIPATADDAAALLQRANRDATKTRDAISNDIRANYQKLTRGDADVANKVTELMDYVIIKNADDLSRVDGMLRPVKSIARLGNVTKEEEQILAFQALLNTKDKATITPEMYDILDKYSTKYMRLFGKEAGTLLDEPPKHLTLWDTLKKLNSIKVTSSAVSNGEKTWAFNVRDAYNIMDETDLVAANARALWANRLTEALPDNFKIDAFNTPLMEKAINDMRSGATKSITLVGENSIPTVISSADELAGYMLNVKVAAAKELLAKANTGKLDLDEESIASLLNVNWSWMNNGKLASSAGDILDDLNAIQTITKQHRAKMEGIAMAPTSADPLLGPRTVKLISDTSVVSEMEELAQPFMVYHKQQQVLYKQASDRAVAGVLGTEKFNQLAEWGDDFIATVTRNPAGGTMFKAADGTYGTAASKVENIGSVVALMKKDSATYVSDVLDAVGAKLINNTKASAEVAAISTRLQATPEQYVLDVANNRIIHKGYQKHLRLLDEGKPSVMMPLVDSAAPLEIPFETAEALNFFRVHHDISSPRLSKFGTLRALNSGEELMDADVLYIPRPNPSEYKHYAFVTDPQITGSNQQRMLWANSPEELEQLIAKVPEEFKAGVTRNPGINVKTGPEVARWKRALQDYERDDSLTTTYFDAAMHKSGGAAPFIPAVDGKLIFDRFKSWHIRQEQNLIEEAVAVKYAKEFKELDNLARGHQDAHSSRLGGGFTDLFKPADQTALKVKNRAGTMKDNPYFSYINTALGRTNTDDIPARALQEWADKKVSELWQGVNNFWDTAKGRTGKVEDLDVINDMFKKHGLATINYDAMTLALANHRVAKGSLETFTRRLNGMIASVSLGLDPLHAINNRVGLLIKLAPETNAVIKAIAAKNPEAVGALANITIPGGNKSYFSVQKVIARAHKNWAKPENKAWANANGISTPNLNEIDDLLDHIATGLKPGDLDLDTLMDSAYSKFMNITRKGAKFTGNLRAEEATKVISALVMKDFTDLAIQQGVMTAKEAMSYIRTFVNRSNGVYAASQRPLMFNGPIGQSMGLYQSYYLGVVQQVLRYAATGEKSSMALMAALQGSIYGMAGMPGFHAINSSLVGEFSSNAGHKDIYNAVYENTDKNLAEWLMFGALSNAPSLISPELKTNIYNRGDINPRQLSIIPLDPRDHAAINMTGKFFNTLIDSFGQLLGGADKTQVFLQGLEHNGISRPLAGLAQTLQAFTNENMQSYATSKNGALIGVNDIMSLTSLARIAGARPLDEALAAEQSYKEQVLESKKYDKTKKLGARIKTKMVGKQKSEIDPEELEGFMEEYVKLGGSQKNFNRYMMRQYSEANTSLSNRLSKKLNSPYSQKMQLLMGGTLHNDFNSIWTGVDDSE